MTASIILESKQSRNDQGTSEEKRRRGGELREERVSYEELERRGITGGAVKARRSGTGELVG